jgi:ketosteroid isomerase-like protein
MMRLAGWLAPGLIAASAVFPLVARAQETPPAAFFEDLEHKLAAAWVQRDRTFIEGVLAPDWTVTDPSGHVLTRDEVIGETFASTERRVDQMTVDDLRVRLLGSSAIVTGRTRATGSYRGEAATVALRFTDVFALRDGRWRIVASQGTLIAP